MDILATIDAAIGCQHCARPLDRSPSDDFCSDPCQAAWHAERATPLIGYVEPWDDGSLPGVGEDAWASDGTQPTLREPIVWGLPRQRGNLINDLRALRLAEATATTDSQRAACAVRAEALAARSAEAFKPMTRFVESFFAAVAESFKVLGQALAPLFATSTGAVRQPAGQAPSGRGHGPQPSLRPPRTIGRASTSARR